MPSARALVRGSGAARDPMGRPTDDPEGPASDPGRGLAVRPVVVEGRVPADASKGERMVEDHVGEESPGLIGPRRVVREEEPVALERLPEEFGRQRVVLGAVLSAPFEAFESSAERIIGAGVAYLHTKGRRPRQITPASRSPALGGPRGQMKGDDRTADPRSQPR